MQVPGADPAGDDQKTSFAISTDETRYILNGVFFEPREGGKVRMVATDGHRLALVERELGRRLQAQGRGHHPAQGAARAQAACSTRRPTPSARSGFAENSALFKKPGLTMVMRLIDGQFPEYQRVIPKEGERKVKIPRVRFIEALKRIALLSADKSNAVKIGLTDNQLRISSQNPDLGEAKDDIEVQYDGGDITIGFNARYLTRRARACSRATRSPSSSETTTARASCTRPGDRSYTAVVMPMRV